MDKKFVLKIDAYNIQTRMLTLLLFFMPVSYYLNLILQNGLNRGISVAALFYVIGFCVGISSYLVVLSKKNILSALVFLIFIFGTEWYLLFYGEYSKLVYTNITDLAYNPSIILFVYCLPVLFLLICGSIDFTLLMKEMYKAGKLVLILFAICFFYFRIGTSSLSIEYMTFSYYALPAICICLAYTDYDKKSQLLEKVLVILGLVITLIAGARGALVCNMVFILLLVLFSQKISKNKKILICVILAISIFLISIFFNEILSGLLAFLNSKGIYSRTLSKMTQASFANSDDRNILWEVALAATKKSPLLGYGMWGDRPIVNGYVHNIVVELLCSYGFLFGGMLLVLLFGLLVQVFTESKQIEPHIFGLFLISIPMGIVQLMFSGSYLTNMWFFFVLGIIYNAKKMRRYDESNTDI